MRSSSIYNIYIFIYLYNILYNTNIFFVRSLNACINWLVLYVKSNNFAGYFSTVAKAIYKVIILLNQHIYTIKVI